MEYWDVNEKNVERCALDIATVFCGNTSSENAIAVMEVIMDRDVNFCDALLTVAPVAQQIGKGLADCAGALEVLEEARVTGSKAGTDLRVILLRLYNHSDQVRRVLVKEGFAKALIQAGAPEEWPKLANMIGERCKGSLKALRRAASNGALDEATEGAREAMAQ